MALVVALAIAGPWVAPFAASDIIGKPFQPPTASNLLGTDYLGHDALSVFLFGGRALIVMSLVAALLGVTVGAVVGIVAAYFGGIVEAVLMRIVDILLAFPTVVFVLLLVSMAGPNPVLLTLAVALAHVPSVARVIRSAALPIIRRDYVAWARSIGLSAARIIVHEVLPSVTSPLMVEFGLRLMWSVGALAALSFLGYGVQPPAADWGLMVSQNRNGLSTQPLVVIAPIIAIAAFTIGGNLFAEGVARVIARTEEKSS